LLDDKVDVSFPVAKLRSSICRIINTIVSGFYRRATSKRFNAQPPIGLGFGYPEDAA
jgi:hypothetical protein